jgi:hypothetical protein
VVIVMALSKKGTDAPAMTRGDTICRGLGAALANASVRLVRSCPSKPAAASAFVLQPPSPDHQL